jgi:hypothetical protein
MDREIIKQYIIKRQWCGGGSTIGEDGHVQWRRKVVGVIGR